MRQVIRTTEQLRALRSPLRQQVLQAAQRLVQEEPREVDSEQTGASVGELASALGEPRESLYYHVKALVKAGFLVPSGERGAGRSSERLYRPVADDIMADPENNDPDFVLALADVGSSVIRNSERRYRHTLIESRAAPESGGLAQLRRYVVRLEPEAEETLQELLMQIETLVSKSEGSTGRSYELTFVVTAEPELD